MATAEVLFRTEERNVKQLTLFDKDSKFLTVCKSGAIGENKCVVSAGGRVWVIKRDSSWIGDSGIFTIFTTQFVSDPLL